MIARAAASIASGGPGHPSNATPSPEERHNRAVTTVLAAGGTSGSIGVRAVAENQPGDNQNRMTSEFSEFTARWREHLLPEMRDSRGSGPEVREACLEPPGVPSGE